MADCGLSMFKAYDIRIRHQNLTEEMMSDLASATAKYMAEDACASAVVLAHDARLYSPELMEVLIGAFLDAGLDVLTDPLQISTCRFYFMCMKNPSACGVMVTASHNPGDYIGLKLVGKGCTPIASGFGPSGGIDRIRGYYSSRSCHRSASRGHIRCVSLQDEYVRYSLKLAGVKKGSLRGLKVFSEFLSGAGGADFLMAFDFAGADLTFSHLIPDGLFPAGAPNPIIESSIAPARRIMRSGNYDIGFCFDGDGDRMDLMFPDGEQVMPSMNIARLAPYLAALFPSIGSPKCYLDVKASPIAAVRTARMGIEPHMIRNGHSYIKEKLRERFCDGFILAVEESAHYYMDFPYDADDFSRGVVAAENTLFFSLLSARVALEDRAGFLQMKRIQSSIARMREWSMHFDLSSTAAAVMAEIENMAEVNGFSIIRTSVDGEDLDATIMRLGLPDRFDGYSTITGDWCQISERISRSEDGIVRWEISAGSRELCDKYNAMIRAVTDKYVVLNSAHYC